jgi:hypothetical protein
MTLRWVRTEIGARLYANVAHVRLSAPERRPFQATAARQQSEWQLRPRILKSEEHRGRRPKPRPQAAGSFPQAGSWCSGVPKSSSVAVLHLAAAQ